MSISKVEVLPILGELIEELHLALQDDQKIDFGEWVKIATEVGKKAFEEYSDEDDV